jgi:hypothetical protein
MWFLHESIYLLKRTVFKSLSLVAMLSLAGFLLAQLSALLLHPDLSDHLWLDQVPVEIYMEPNEATLSALLTRAEALPELELVQIVSAQDAADEFELSYGLQATDLLGENPFPTTLRFKLKAGFDRAALPAALKTLAAGQADYHVNEELYDGIGTRIRRFIVALSALVFGVFLLLLLMLRLGTKSERSAYRLERQLLKDCGATPAQERLPEIFWQLSLIFVAWLCVFSGWTFEGVLLSSFDLNLELPLAFWFLLPAFNLLAFQLFRSKKSIA